MSHLKTGATSDIRIVSREDMESLANRYSSDITVEPIDLLLKSDKFVELTEGGTWRLPSLSVINGSEFVNGVTKRAVHGHVYSEQFNKYAAQILELTTDRCTLERHFFAHGIELGIWLKVLHKKTVQ